jgi:tetratricopeptide (TPR) repeat protein
MGLDNQQKNYIKRNLRHYPISKIAADLNLHESEVLGYLKKKWSPEKYEKFVRNQSGSKKSSSENSASFSFVNFFRENRITLAFLAFLVFTVYANSFGNGFVSDDVGGFLKNPNIGKFSSVTGNPMHFSLPGFFQFIAYHIGGMHPLTFRIINIFAHLGSVFLVYILLSLSMNKNTAVIAASIFAVHPILIESISWISGGLYSIYGFFFLLSFLFYLFANSNRKYYYYSIVFYIMALFSSEKAIVLFLIFILYELAFGSVRYNWRKIIPFFSVSFVLTILYVSKIGSRVSDVAALGYQQQATEGFFNPFIQIPVAVGSYLKLIFWPAKLTLYQTEMAFTQGQYILFILITLVFFSAIIWGYFKNKNIFFWLAFFFITLLPTLTPFKISWIVAERYAYLGTLGIIVAFAVLLNKLLKLNENAKMVGYFALVVIIVSLSVRTIIRNQDWKSEDTLWLATAQVAPSGQQIHNNLGDVYARQGNLDKAVEEFKTAININPNYADAYHNLANTYQQMGQVDLAVENYQKALEINPQIWQSYQNLAAIYFNQGEYDLAEENIKKALEVNPGDQNLQNALKYIEESGK